MLCFAGFPDMTLVENVNSRLVTCDGVACDSLTIHCYLASSLSLSHSPSVLRCDGVT